MPRAVLSPEEKLKQIVESAFDRAGGNAEAVVKSVTEEVFRDTPLVQALFQGTLRNTVLAILYSIRRQRGRATGTTDGKAVESEETSHSVDYSIAQAFLQARGVNVIDVIDVVEADNKPAGEPCARAHAAGAGKK
jgi:hypothetical protein